MTTREPIIRLQDVSIGWDGKPVLRNVNLDIYRGDFLAITGPNGGGKTTLLRIILKLLRPDTGTVTYYSTGDSTESLRIGYLPQKNMIDARFPITVSDVIAMGIADRRGTSRSEISGRVLDMLHTIGMSEHSEASLGTLSGGQLQRTLLARALVSKPEVLILDEPLSYVDKQFEHRIYEIIANVAPHTTIILVSHEMSTIASMANRHIIVDHGLEFCKSGTHFMHYDCCDHH